MKRKAIKFSGDYPKLHGQTSAELIAVRDIRIDRDTPAELLTYDTTKSDAPVMLACTVAAFLMRRFSVMIISPDGIGLRLKKMPRPRSKH